MSSTDATSEGDGPKDDPPQDPGRGKSWSGFASPEALRDFVDDIKQRVGPDIGRVTSGQEKFEAKWEIARELGLEEEYEPNFFLATNEGAKAARRKVEDRYDELVQSGVIRESIEPDPNQENIYDQINERLTPDEEAAS